MVLSLISPIGGNFLQDFPEQNSVNLDRIDAYANASLTSHPLKQYTPIFTAAGGGFTIGTGGPAVMRAFYYEIFDQIHLWGEFRFGTTSPNAGSGVWSATLPFNAKSLIGPSTTLGAAPVIGNGSIYCNSTANNRQGVTVHLRTANTIMFGARINAGGGGRELTGSFPIAWAPQDGMHWYARFQRDP